MKARVIGIFGTLALFGLVSMNSFAAEQTYNCKGVQDNSYSMILTEKGNSNVPENTPIDYYLTVKKGTKVLFSAMVTGKQEDVMLSLRSRRGSPKMSGIVYMDELNQTNVSIGEEEIWFDCSGEE